MAFTFKLRPEAGTVPWEEIDVSTRAYPYETEPSDYDAKLRDTRGRLNRVIRGMGRNITLPELVPMTESELDILRRWAMNRTRLALSPNWNGSTKLYARYSRLNPYTQLPDTVYGPAATFTRSMASSNASATQKRIDGKYVPIAQNIARFESASAANAFGRMSGVRPFWRVNNYFGQSHPKSGALIFTLNNVSGNAAWQWNANLPRIVTDADSGAGFFLGDSGDNLQTSVASYGGAGPISVGIWVQGEGAFRLNLSGGATAQTADTTLSPTIWTLLRLENQTASGASVTVQLYSRSTASWCAVSAMQFNAGRRLGGYIHNVTNSTVYQMNVDDLYYDFQVPNFSPTIHIGLEMPDLWASGEQCILGVDQGGGNRFVLRYDASTSKMSFQKKTSSAKVEWTAERGLGQGTVISLVAGRDGYFAYENGNFKAFVAGVMASIPKGLHVGWDGVSGNETSAWGGLVFFLRVDQASIDPNEISYISSLYNDSQQIAWTRACEGRLFEIATPTHRMQADKYFSTLSLSQVASVYGATHEVP